MTYSKLFTTTLILFGVTFSHIATAEQQALDTEKYSKPLEELVASGTRDEQIAALRADLSIMEKQGLSTVAEQDAFSEKSLKLLELKQAATDELLRGAGLQPEDTMGSDLPSASIIDRLLQISTIDTYGADLRPAEFPTVTIETPEGF